MPPTHALPSIPVPLFGRLSGSTSPYGYVEMAPTRAGGWAVVEGGEQCDDCAYEPNGIAGRGGKIVRLHNAAPGAPGEYRIELSLSRR